MRAYAELLTLIGARAQCKSTHSQLNTSKPQPHSPLTQAEATPPPLAPTPSLHTNFLAPSCESRSMLAALVLSAQLQAGASWFQATNHPGPLRRNDVREAVGEFLFGWRAAWRSEERRVGK